MAVCAASRKICVCVSLEKGSEKRSLLVEKGIIGLSLVCVRLRCKQEISFEGCLPMARGAAREAEARGPPSS